ncbi:hypothetical protein [Catenulispora yoronensis]
MKREELWLGLLIALVLVGWMLRGQAPNSSSPPPTPVPAVATR